MHVIKCLCRFEVNEWDGKHSFGIVNESYRFCISKTLNPTMKCKEQSQIVSITWLSAKMQVNMGIQVVFFFGYFGSPAVITAYSHIHQERQELDIVLLNGRQ